MTRKGTAGRLPQSNIGANESGIDKAIKKTKEIFDSENEATNYEEVDDQADAIAYSERKAKEDDKNKE